MKKILAAVLALSLCLALSACRESAKEAKTDIYTIKVIDSNGDPVSGVRLDACTDVTCRLFTSDQNGTVEFPMDGIEYTVHVLAVPDGYGKDILSQEFRINPSENRLTVRFGG